MVPRPKANMKITWAFQRPIKGGATSVFWTFRLSSSQSQSYLVTTHYHIPVSWKFLIHISVIMGQSISAVRDEAKKESAEAEKTANDALNSLQDLAKLQIKLFIEQVK